MHSELLNIEEQRKNEIEMKRQKDLEEFIKKGN
jgi:hypothetical protein